MTDLRFLFVFVPILALILLALSIILSPHNPYQEKNTAFACGFISFLGKNSTKYVFNLKTKKIITFLLCF